MPSNRDVVVVGGSAGSLSAFKQLIASLPADLPAAVFVVSHLTPDGVSFLPEILSRAGALPALVPDDNAAIECGRVYIGPPDRHLLVERGRVRVVRGPKENRHRPAIDALFRSAAWAYGPRVIGIVLSGYQDDGTSGLWAIKTCGGVTIIQDPLDALHPDMPNAAARVIDVDHVLPVSEIGPLVVDLVREPIILPETFAGPESLKTEIEFAKMHRDMTDMSSLGTLSAFTCPACRGALWELQDGDILRYRCHTGHAFSRDSLLSEQSVAIEDALYSALRAVEEKAAALRRLGERVAERSPKMMADYTGRADELEATADLLRSLLSGQAA